MTHAKLAALLGVHPQTVQRWVAEWRVLGEESFVPKPLHGNAAAQRKMTPQQEDWVDQQVRGHTPRDLAIAETDLWTIQRVRELIARDLGIEVSIPATHRMMVRKGLRPRVPLRRSYTRDEAEVERFIREEWPAAARLSDAGARLLFLDEAGVREDSPAGTTWSRKGVRPMVQVKGTRAGVQVVTAVGLDGDLWFQTFQGTLNAVKFCSLLEDLLGEFTEPLVVVVDRHPTHRARLTQQFVADHADRLRLVELPRYAPDLNPAEHVWSYLKGHVLRRYPVQRHEKIRDVVDAEMESIQSQRTLVQSFFRHPAVHYTLAPNTA